MLKNRKGEEREIYRQKMEMLRIETCNEAGILGIVSLEAYILSRNQKLRAGFVGKRLCL
jgi:hypothetical protein